MNKYPNLRLGGVYSLENVHDLYAGYDDKTLGVSNVVLSCNNEEENKQYIELIKRGDNKKNILDFGGGSNMSHYEVVKNLPEIKKYIIVDTNLQHQGNYPQIKFYKDIRNVKEEIDLFYSRCSLQYPYDIDILCEIEKIKPKYILLHEIPCTDKKEFYSLQITKSRKGKLFYKIFSIEKMFEILKEYTLDSEFPSLQRSEITCFKEEFSDQIWFEDFCFKLR